MRRRQIVSLVPRAAAIAAVPALAPAFVRNAFADEAGLSAKAITIGSTVSLSGPLAAYGTDIKLGTEAAMAQINARGGIHGRTLQLQIVDDGYVPQRSADNVR